MMKNDFYYYKGDTNDTICQSFFPFSFFDFTVAVVGFNWEVDCPYAACDILFM